MDLRRMALLNQQKPGKVFLIKNGIFQVSASDWTKHGGSNYTVDQQAGYIRYKSWGGNGKGFYIRNNSINMSSYSEAFFEINVAVKTTYDYFGLLSFARDSSGADVAGRFLLLNKIATGTVSADLSNLSGDLYPMLCHTMYDNARTFEIRITNAWLE